MNQTTKSLEDRANDLFSKFSEEALTIVRQIEDDFTDYMLGMDVQQHQDLRAILSGDELYGININDLPEQEKKNIKDYVFLQNVLGSSERISSEFIQAYDGNKYRREYTLHNFILTWQTSTKDFVLGALDSGAYSPIITGIFGILAKNNELINYMFDHDGPYEEIDSFLKAGVISAMAKNSDIFYEVFLGTLNPELRKEAEEIVYDTRLAREAANSFLDVYANLKDNGNFNLENFLQYYDAETQGFNPRRRNDKKSYSSLYNRLKLKSRNNWKNLFYELIDDHEDPLRSRVENLDNDMGKSGIIEEDIIGVLELINQSGNLDILDMFAENGSDYGDALLAMNIENLTQQQIRTLSEGLRKGKESISPYLGKCRVRSPDSGTQYDWRHAFFKITEQIDPTKFEGQQALYSILVNKSIQLYGEGFKEDKQVTLETIRLDMAQAPNPVHYQILERTLSHYELRMKLGGVVGFRDKLPVISTS